MDNLNQQNTHNSSKISNIPSSVEVIIFDLDKTLINETICKETETVLQKLKEQQYSLAIASYNAYAKWFCDRYNISKYFVLSKTYFIGIALCFMQIISIK